MDQEKVKRIRNRRTSSKMDQVSKAEKEQIERIQNMQEVMAAPLLPKHLVSEEDYNQYRKDSYNYYYEVYGTRITICSYAEYVKSYRKR